MPMPVLQGDESAAAQAALDARANPTLDEYGNTPAAIAAQQVALEQQNTPPVLSPQQQANAVNDYASSLPAAQPPPSGYVSGPATPTGNPAASAPVAMPHKGPSAPVKPDNIDASSPEGLAALGANKDGLSKIQREELYGQEDANKATIDAREHQNRLITTAQQTAQQTLAQSQRAQADSQARQDANQLKHDQLAAQAAASADAAIAKQREMASQIKDVDPDNRSIPAKILGAVAMAMGAYGAGITHSQNFALNIINEHIKDQVDAQKANINKQWKAIEQEHGFSNDEQAKYAHQQEALDRADIYERSKLNTQLQGLAATQDNATAQANMQGLIAANTAEMDKTRENMVKQRFSFLQTNQSKAEAQAAAGAARQVSEAHRLEDRHDKFIEHAISKTGGNMSPDEAEGRWNASITGQKYVADPNTPQHVDPSVAVADTNGQVRAAVSPEAQKATEPLMRAVRTSKQDLEAYSKDPSEANYARAVESSAQVDALRRAPNTPKGLFERLGITNVGNPVADSIPKPVEVRLNPKSLDSTKSSLDAHARVIEESAFGKQSTEQQASALGATATSDIKAKTNITPANDHLSKFLEENKRAMEILDKRYK